jgi:hypothetical protein
LRRHHPRHHPGGTVDVLLPALSEISTLELYSRAPAHYHLPLFVKLLHCLLAAAAVSLCACAVAPSPTAPTRLATVDASMAGDGFEPAFYRALLQNAYEQPNRLEPIRILRQPLRVYLRLQDDRGRAIDGETLDATERALRESAWIWSGDTFGVVEVARGTASRESVAGWVTVKWAVAALGDRCGRSTVGIDGGFIELNASGACSCGTSSLVYPRLVRHELGHAMGYYHTDDVNDVMYGHAIPRAACDTLPSDRERRHARYAHAVTAPAR